MIYRVLLSFIKKKSSDLGFNDFILQKYNPRKEIDSILNDSKYLVDEIKKILPPTCRKGSYLELKFWIDKANRYNFQDKTRQEIIDFISRGKDLFTKCGEILNNSDRILLLGKKIKYSRRDIHDLVESYLAKKGYPLKFIKSVEDYVNVFIYLGASASAVKTIRKEITDSPLYRESEFSEVENKLKEFDEVKSEFEKLTRM